MKVFCLSFSCCCCLIYSEAEAEGEEGDLSVLLPLGCSLSWGVAGGVKVS